MRMSAEDVIPVVESGEQKTAVSDVGAIAGGASTTGVPGAGEVIMKGSDVTFGDDSIDAVTATSPPPEEALQGAELLGAIKNQVEFYFSRQNLQTDGFLVSQMNAQMCVPVSVIAQFHKIQQLTSDTALIVDSVKDSTVCAVTADGIKPSIKQERNTIILREIPSETLEDKVREIFTGEGIAPIKNIRSDVGDTWFVTMDSEDDALSTILALRSKNFEGKPIKARLKSENILRSFFPVPTAAEVQPTAAAAAAAPYVMTGPASTGGTTAGMHGMPYGMPGMGTPMMNGQPSYGYPGPAARGMYGRGGNMMMQAPGGMRYGGMQHSGMVQAGAGAGGREAGMMQPRGGGGMQMAGMGGMHGVHQGQGMGQPHLGMGMNAKQLQQQQQQYQQHHQQQQQQQPPQQQQQPQRQHSQHHQHQGENRGDKKGSVRDREAMQQGSIGSVGNGGVGSSHQPPSGTYGQGQRGGEARSGGGDRPRKGDRASNPLHGRGEGGRGGGSGKGRNSGGRDMLSAANFPPLPGAEGAPAGAAAATARSAAPVTPALDQDHANVSQEAEEMRDSSAAADSVVAAGYPGPFIQYQQDEILKIVSTLSQADVAVVPGVQDIGQHDLVFEREPNVGLLMRQRSVSIDECREQLRKGRPVHREGVIAGAVDFSSYMYGEGHEQQGGQAVSTSSGAGSAMTASGSGHLRGGGGGGGSHGNGEGYSGGGGAGGSDRKKGDRGRRDRGDRSGAGGDEKTSRGSRGNTKNLTSAAAPEPMGAYAAALLKKPAPVPPVPQQQQQSTTSTKPPSSKSSGKPGGGSSRDRKGESRSSKDSSSGGAPISASSGGGNSSSSGAAHDSVPAKHTGGSGSVASKSREAGGKDRGEGRGREGGNSASSRGPGGAPRPTRGWEKPDVTQSKRGWSGDSSKGNKANSSAKHPPSTSGGASGSDDKKSSSSTGSATVSVSGDEGGDTSSSSPREAAAVSGGEGSADGGRREDKALVGSKDSSAGSEGDGIDASSSNAAAVVKAPGNPPPPTPAVSKPSPQPMNKRAESLKSPSRRGRPDRDSNSNIKSPMRGGGGGARGDRDRGDSKSHHQGGKDLSRGHMSNGRAGGGDYRGGGPREKGAWA